MQQTQSAIGLQQPSLLGDAEGREELRKERVDKHQTGILYVQALPDFGMVLSLDGAVLGRTKEWRYRFRADELIVRRLVGRLRPLLRQQMYELSVGDSFRRTCPHSLPDKVTRRDILARGHIGEASLPEDSLKLPRRNWKRTGTAQPFRQPGHDRFGSRRQQRDEDAQEPRGEL